MLHDLKEETVVAQLGEVTVLSTRAALDFPARVIVVAYMCSKSRTPDTPQDDRAAHDLLALDGIVDEVVLMGIPPEYEHPSEADRLVRYSETYDSELPADVTRDWPMWLPLTDGM